MWTRKKSLMNSLLEEVLDTRKLVDNKGNVHDPLPIGADREQCVLLQKLVDKTHPKRTLETGLGYGISALAITEVLARHGGVQHIAMDPFQELTFGNCGTLLMGRSDYAHLFDFRLERSEYLLPELCQSGLELDFAYLDAHHTFDAALLEFVYADRMVRVGGMIVLDDVHMPALARVSSFVKNNMAYKPIWPGECGKQLFAAFEKVGDDNRQWDHYNPF